MEKFKVNFSPDKKSVNVDKGTTILAAALSANIYLNSNCGGDGVCGKCKVMVKKGKAFSQPSGALTAKERERGYCLGCQALVESDLEVLIPPASRLNSEKSTQECLEFEPKNTYSKSEEDISIVSIPEPRDFVHSPLTTKVYLELPPPSHTDRISDLERLYREIKRSCNICEIETELANFRELGQLLRDSDWKVTVTLGKAQNTVEIILIEPGDTSTKNYGFSFDIGTTTISAQLLDLNTKEVLGAKIACNKQASFGSDVITRIIYARNSDGLEKLHQAVVGTMNGMIQELAEENKVDLNNVNSVLCAGNTTMMHILLRIDPTYLRKEPYVPTASFLPVIHASGVGININPRGFLYCVPGVASYVGGDICAGILHCGIDRSDKLSLLIDIGTNGEIALGNKEFIIAAAASAGPAFEGSGLKCGMRAAKGAIQKVKINQDNFKVSFEVVGKLEPVGICGSGYIDIISQMLKIGLINKEGKINPQKTPRIRQGELGMEFVIAFAEDTSSGSDIVVTEADIANLKCAKAAMYAAATNLLKQIGKEFSDIEAVFIAGGFGTYIDVENGVEIGLLPDIEREKFIFVGNSSLAGAREALLSAEALKQAENIARKVTYVELSIEAAYMDEYTAAMFFPHTDNTRFPSVGKN